MKIRLPVLAAAAAAVAAPAIAAPAPRAEQASIPFANHAHAIRNFEAPSDDTLYLEDRRRRWYRADVGPCFGLKWANAIGYDTRGGINLDSFGAILVDGQRCPIVSLTHSEGPPRKVKKAKRG
ncbi:MAG TPA: DUF6491 family protein [Allosphingosinicella sp.]|jgi:hypothetical protein